MRAGTVAGGGATGGAMTGEAVAGGRRSRARALTAFAAGLLTLTLATSRARAGGFETPDNGTEALGRGGAFVAKADDGTAIEYNIAGLARQRGTRITLDGNFVLSDIAFTRAGSYPGNPGDTRTPYAGQRYATTHDKEGVFVAPFLAVSSDLGWFERWTFALGVYGPPSKGAHNYDVGARGPGMTDDPQAEVTLPGGQRAPGPARYDLAKTNLLIVFPTLAAAVRVTRWLDLGLAAQLVYGNFDLSSANITPPLLPRTLCPQPDYGPCDSYAKIQTSGFSGTGIVSAEAPDVPTASTTVSRIGTTIRARKDGLRCTVFPRRAGRVP